MARLSLSRRLSYSLAALALLLGAAECAFRLLEAVRPAAPEGVGLSVPDPRPGIRRLFTIGGSTTLGYPVNEFGFVKQSEFWLQRPSGSIEVLNLGQNGSDSSSVLARARLALEHDADILVILTGHNEFLRAQPHPSDRAWITGLRERSAIVRTVLRWSLRREDAPLPGDSVLPRRQRTFDRESEEFQSRLARFRRNLEAVSALAREADVSLVLCTAPCNLRDWHPAYKDLVDDPAYQDEAEAIFDLLAEGRLADVRLRSQAARQRWRCDAVFTYLEGRAVEAGGDVEEARRWYHAAKEADPIPWRALDAVNGITQEVAAKGGHLLVDMVAALDQAAGEPIGRDWISDNVHPTPVGAAVMARELLTTLQSARLVAPAELPSHSEMAMTYLATFAPDVLRTLEWRSTFRSAMHCMKPPHYNYREARRYLEAARQGSEEDWKVEANLASLAALEGKLEEARQRYDLACALHGGPMDAEDRRVVPYLKEALARMAAGGTPVPGSIP